MSLSGIISRGLGVLVAVAYLCLASVSHAESGWADSRGYGPRVAADLVSRNDWRCPGISRAGTDRPGNSAVSGRLGGVAIPVGSSSPRGAVVQMNSRLAGEPSIFAKVPATPPHLYPRPTIRRRAA